MRQHYIPQFLLRAWAETTADKKVESFQLDLPHRQSSRLAPQSTAYENDLYSLTEPEVAGMKQQAVETDFLQRIDDLAARVLHKMATTGFADLTLEDGCNWVYFIMSLRSRTPETVSRIHTEGSGYLKDSLDDKPEEYDAISKTSDPTTLAEWTERRFPGLIENFGIMSFPKLVCNPEIGQKILRMKWWLWNFRGQKNHLLLADRPCIFTKGIDDPDLVIALPIGPWKAFMAIKTDRVADSMRCQRLQDLLMRINESSLGQAQSRVYARDASPRQFILNTRKPTGH